jgi:CRISPR-associated protein Cas5d
MTAHPLLEVHVWGDYACFTRPEMKVERVSYSVMTPSAARGMLEAIFWKPEFEWDVREIAVLKPIRFYSILRNEVNSRASTAAAAAAIERGDGYYAEDDRAQRHTLALRDVAYVIRANIVLNSHATDDVAKYRDQFRRRVAKGQCFTQPVLGCREFSASFGEPSSDLQPTADSTELGRTLYDLDYAPDRTGRGTPIFFEAKLDQGVLRVPGHLHRRTR